MRTIASIRPFEVVNCANKSEIIRFNNLLVQNGLHWNYNSCFHNSLDDLKDIVYNPLGETGSIEVFKQRNLKIVPAKDFFSFPDYELEEYILRLEIVKYPTNILHLADIDLFVYCENELDIDGFDNYQYIELQICSASDHQIIVASNSHRNSSLFGINKINLMSYIELRNKKEGKLDFELDYRENNECSEGANCGVYHGKECGGKLTTRKYIIFNQYHEVVINFKLKDH